MTTDRWATQAVGAFYLALSHHLRARRLGQVLLSPMDVVLDYERALIVQPDLLFVSKARAHSLKQRVLGAPDLVLEVLSPNPRIGALQERIDWFAAYGVREIPGACLAHSFTYMTIGDSMSPSGR